MDSYFKNSKKENMNKANQAVIFINREKPELIYPAAEILLQIPKGAQIVPCSFQEIMSYELHCEDVYILEIEAKTEAEKSLLKEFIANRKKTLKIWTANKQVFNQAGAEESIGYAYELRKLRISIPDYLQKRSALIELGNEEIKDSGAIRVLKALKAQKIFDFNTDNNEGYLSLLGKMITEVITEKLEPEIDALVQIREKLIENTEKEKHQLRLANLQDYSFRSPEFGGRILINLKEINPFLIDIKDFASSIKVPATNFILEYSCLGHTHFLMINQGKISSRLHYLENGNKKKLRKKAAREFGVQTG